MVNIRSTQLTPEDHASDRVKRNIINSPESTVATHHLKTKGNEKIIVKISASEHNTPATTQEHLFVLKSHGKKRRVVKKLHMSETLQARHSSLPVSPTRDSRATRLRLQRTSNHYPHDPQTNETAKLDSLFESYENLRVKVDKSIKRFDGRMKDFKIPNHEEKKNNYILHSLNRRYESDEDSDDSDFEDDLYSDHSSPIKAGLCDSPPVMRKRNSKRGLFPVECLPKLRLHGSVEHAPLRRSSAFVFSSPQYTTTSSSSRRRSCMDAIESYGSPALSTASTCRSPKKVGTFKGALISMAAKKSNKHYPRSASMTNDYSEDDKNRRIGYQETRDLTNIVAKRLDALLSTQRHHETLEV
mmetsp:Transcript_5510/g.6063  ORF Transcript_5510/g.6063 Transcript_5510/m.6063 type:complete len:357 (-) Transcript_5510:447-1517(-)